MSNSVNVIHDQANNEYRIELAPDCWGKLSYQKKGNVLHIDHSSVPSELRGQGAGGKMMEAVLPVIEEDGFHIVPVCSYVIHYLGKHQQWQHLLAVVDE
ncbi:acetyltransferase [Photobacterium jeanii]|uniref:Acetyltransferase n=1 Tax=Photobacterium jeanii TaxID=858640 RepID=A0A178K319_9GAMM|nr:GNAT family N-acetyltransferase [Photobacterium jeanii]OAN11345.1 acetyltransferase [Photobacterium jeanii]PST90865.1 N-acetyltransferase [Photobacterium jeanii]